MANIKIFEEKRVRSIWSETDQQWYFSIVDAIAVLTDSVDPNAYWRKLKERLKKEGNETVTNCHSLKMEAADGKMRFTDVANAQQMLRLIQSIPSPKAEPFKLWMAQVGYERIQEIENPELATQRTRDLYKAKGYPEDWIEKRMRSIAIREELTDEWQKHGVQEQKEYSILTAEIAKATFGLAPSEHKNLKGLKTQNLRDHMTDLELISALRGVLPPRLGLVTQRHFGVMSDSMKICCLPFLELRLRNGVGAPKVQDIDCSIAWFHIEAALGHKTQARRERPFSSISQADGMFGKCFSALIAASTSSSGINL